MSKQFDFKQISLVKAQSLVFIYPIDRTLSGATSSGQSWTGSDGNKGVFRMLDTRWVSQTPLQRCCQYI